LDQREGVGVVVESFYVEDMLFRLRIRNGFRTWNTPSAVGKISRHVILDIFLEHLLVDATLSKLHVFIRIVFGYQWLQH
jgi:hypothetical protein